MLVANSERVTTQLRPACWRLTSGPFKLRTPDGPQAGRRRLGAGRQGRQLSSDEPADMEPRHRGRRPDGFDDLLTAGAPSMIIQRADLWRGSAGTALRDPYGRQVAAMADDTRTSLTSRT
jgi:hypothetical protein